MSLPDRLKEIRKDLGYSQAEMANHFGKILKTYQRCEQGKALPSIMFLVELAIIGYNVHWVVTGDGDKYKNEKKEPGTNTLCLKGIIEEWIQNVREKEGNTDRIVMELALQVPEFRQWYQEKKNKTALAKDDLTREKVA